MKLCVFVVIVVLIILVFVVLGFVYVIFLWRVLVKSVGFWLISLICCCRDFKCKVLIFFLLMSILFLMGL